MMRFPALFLGVALLAAAPPDPTPSPAPSPGCAVPNRPAGVLHARQPDMPAEARGVSGIVEVLVSLDADANVTNAVVQSSASVLLEASALSSARLSTYRTQIADCRPVPSKYTFVVSYN